MGEASGDKASRQGLVVYISAHGRPEYTVLTVRSILDQEVEGGFRFIVSDNSDDDCVYMALEDAGLPVGTKGKSCTLEYKRRGMAEADAMHHWDLCYNEARLSNARYYVMFHNDDLMLLGCLQKELDVLRSGDYSACGCREFGIDQSGKLMADPCGDEKDDVMCSDIEVFRRFGTFPPYWSYLSWASTMYDLERMGHLVPPNNVGVNSDQTWMALVAGAAGGIYTVGKRYVAVRWGHEHDSGGWRIGDAILLFHEFKRAAKNKKDLKLLRMGRMKSIIQHYWHMHKSPLPMRVILLVFFHVPWIYQKDILREIRSDHKRLKRGIKKLMKITYRKMFPSGLRGALWHMRHPKKAQRMEIRQTLKDRAKNLVDMKAVRF